MESMGPGHIFLRTCKMVIANWLFIPQILIQQPGGGLQQVTGQIVQTQDGQTVIYQQVPTATPAQTTTLSTPTPPVAAPAAETTTTAAQPQTIQIQTQQGGCTVP